MQERTDPDATLNPVGRVGHKPQATHPHTPTRRTPKISTSEDLDTVNTPELAPVERPTPHLLKSGAPAHILTAEDRQKALETRRQKAAERKAAGRSMLEVLAETVEESAEEIVRPWLAQAKAGDWKAAEAILHNLHGKPAQRIVVERGIGGVDPGELEPGDVAELERLMVERLRVTKSDP
jgi:hypothetical protein